MTRRQGVLVGVLGSLLAGASLVVLAYRTAGLLADAIDGR